MKNKKIEWNRRSCCLRDAASAAISLSDASHYQHNSGADISFRLNGEKWVRVSVVVCGVRLRRLYILNALRRLIIHAYINNFVFLSKLFDVVFL